MTARSCWLTFRPLPFARFKNNCRTNTILVRQWGIIQIQRKTACRFAKGGLSKRETPYFLVFLRNTPPIARNCPFLPCALIDGVCPRLYGYGENVCDWIHAEDNSSAASWAGNPGTPISPRASPRQSAGTESTSPGGAPPRGPPKRAIACRGCRAGRYRQKAGDLLSLLLQKLAC